MATLASYHRKRGSVRGLVTRLSTRIAGIESAKRTSDTADEVRRIVARLQLLTDEFKLHHYSVLDLIEDEGVLATEQEILKAHKDTVSNLFTRLDKLTATCSAENDTQTKLATKHLEYLEKEISSMHDSISSPTEGISHIAVEQWVDHFVAKEIPMRFQNCFASQGWQPQWH